MEFPQPQRAIVSAFNFLITCPCCGTTVAEQVAAEPAAGGGFAIPPERRFDLCSHCGAFLDLGAFASIKEAA